MTADFSLGLLEDDPQPMLSTNRGHLYEVQEIEVKNDVYQENIDRFGRLTTFSFHDMCLTPVLFNMLQNCFGLGD